MYPSLDGPRGKPWLPRPSRTSDMVVNACQAIVAATSLHQLTEGVAVALAGELGDCVIVDASPDGEMTRSVAGPGPELAARLSRLEAGGVPADRHHDPAGHAHRVCPRRGPDAPGPPA